MLKFFLTFRSLLLNDMHSRWTTLTSPYFPPAPPKPSPLSPSLLPNIVLVHIWVLLPYHINIFFSSGNKKKIMLNT